MNPYPFVGLNHFTVPVAISVSNLDRARYGSRPSTTRAAIGLPSGAPTNKIANPMLSAHRYSLKWGDLTPLAFGCCRVHTTSHEHSLRSNRLFGRC
jgi:hypothetical protein